jgi:hypothetical protein
MESNREQRSFQHHYTREEEKILFNTWVEFVSWSLDGRFLFSSSRELHDFSVWDTAKQASILKQTELIPGNRADSNWVGKGAVSSAGNLLAITLNKPRFDEVKRKFTNETKEIRCYDVPRNVF